MKAPNNWEVSITKTKTISLASVNSIMVESYLLKNIECTISENRRLSTIDETYSKCLSSSIWNIYIPNLGEGCSDNIIIQCIMKPTRYIIYPLSEGVYEIKEINKSDLYNMTTINTINNIQIQLNITEYNTSFIGELVNNNININLENSIMNKIYNIESIQSDFNIYYIVNKNYTFGYKTFFKMQTLNNINSSISNIIKVSIYVCPYGSIFNENNETCICNKENNHFKIKINENFYCRSFSEIQSVFSNYYYNIMDTNQEPYYDKCNETCKICNNKNYCKNCSDSYSYYIVHEIENLYCYNSCPLNYYVKEFTFECMEECNDFIFIDNNYKSHCLKNCLLNQYYYEEGMKKYCVNSIEECKNKGYYINNRKKTCIKIEQNTNVPGVIFVDLKECRQYLLDKYDIDYIIINSTKDDFILINPENLSEIKISECENYEYQIEYPKKLDDKLLDKISSYPDINIFNINDKAFQDYCYKLNVGNKDTTLSKRKDEIYIDLKVCKKNCEIDYYNFSSNKAVCICNKPKNIKLIKWFDITKYANFYVLKCFPFIFGYITFGFYLSILISFLIITLNILYLLFFKRNYNFLTTIENNNPPNRLKFFDYRSQNYYSCKTTKRSFITLIKNPFKNSEYLSLYELSNLNFKKALLIDKRTYFDYYKDLIKIKHIIIVLFIKDENLYINKFNVFLFNLNLYISINTLFFEDESINKIYDNNSGILDRLPKMIISMIISSLIKAILNSLINNQKEISKRKKINNQNELKKIHKRIFIKFFFFF